MAQSKYKKNFLNTPIDLNQNMYLRTAIHNKNKPQ
jgi:hypothetical protein